jgi:glycosyltransferase involved in cell wall biosynthesis
MEAVDVAFLLAGDIRRNSRALRQLGALAGAGLSIHAVGLAPQPSEESHASIRMTHLAPPSGSGPGWFLGVHRAMQTAMVGIDARIYHASDLFVLPAAAKQSRSQLRPLTFDSRELYPHVGATHGKPWASWFWSLVERRYLHRCAATFTVCNSIADRLQEKYSIARPIVVPNIPEFPYRPATSAYLRQWAGIPPTALILLYQGHLKQGRGCTQILDAVEDVPGTHAIFLGDGPLAGSLLHDADQRGIGNRVHHHGAVSPDRLLDVTSGADVGMCLIEPLTESLRLSLPNKLFEYLWAGRPVIGSNLPEISRVILGHDVGKTVDPKSRQEIAAAVRELRDDPEARLAMQSRTRSVAETYRWSEASEAFVAPFKSLLP